MNSECIVFKVEFMESIIFFCCATVKNRIHGWTLGLTQYIISDILMLIFLSLIYQRRPEKISEYHTYANYFVFCE